MFNSQTDVSGAVADDLQCQLRSVQISLSKPENQREGSLAWNEGLDAVVEPRREAELGGPAEPHPLRGWRRL